MTRLIVALLRETEKSWHSAAILEAWEAFQSGPGQGQSSTYTAHLIERRRLIWILSV